jgi:hypothetical protein
VKVERRQRRGHQIRDVVDVLVSDIEPWELDALAQLLDGCEPENGEQAHVLRKLRMAVPMPSTRVPA